MKIPTIAALFLCILAPVHARLGETMAECEKRYGRPLATARIDKLSVARTYAVGNIRMLVLFAKGKNKKKYQARSITYFPGTTRGFRPDMIKTFLKANRGDFVWRNLGEGYSAYKTLAKHLDSIPKQNVQKHVGPKAYYMDTWWISTDKKVFAHEKFRGNFRIATKTYLNYEYEQKHSGF